MQLPAPPIHFLSGGCLRTLIVHAGRDEVELALPLGAPVNAQSAMFDNRLEWTQ
jgi:hypothetical protein